MFGRDLNSWGSDYYQRIGVSFELPNHYLKLTALENLEYFRSLYAGETESPQKLLELVGLGEDGKKRVAQFSKGMSIRLNIARALLHKPDLLFLDEPTSGLDPVNAHRIDERDERTLMALLVTPLPLQGYLLYRMVLPMVVGTIATFVSYPLVGLTPFSWSGLLTGALVGSLLGPQIALFLATFAENKVAGLAMLKLLNTVLLLPLVAFFIPEPWQLIAGIIPAYWPLKFFWLTGTGAASWQAFLIGLIYNMVIVLVLLKRFTVVVHR